MSIIYWTTRAKTYEQLETVKGTKIYDKIIKHAELKKLDMILDAGAGTGQLSKLLFKKGYLVNALEPCFSMIRHINLPIVKIRKPLHECNLNKNIYNKVFIRMVLHHITDTVLLIRSLQEVHRILKPKGMVIIQEGIPPKNLEKEYDEIFKLKEERRVFTDMTLKLLLAHIGFKNIKARVYTQKNFSVRTWLENDLTLTEPTRKKIYNLHQFGSDKFKKLYNLKESNDDIFIDTKYCIVTGEK